MCHGDLFVLFDCFPISCICGVNSVVYLLASLPVALLPLAPTHHTDRFNTNPSELAPGLRSDCAYTTSYTVSHAGYK